MTRKISDALDAFGIALAAFAGYSALTGERAAMWSFVAAAFLVLVAATVGDIRRARSRRRSGADFDTQDRIEPQG